MRSWGRIFTGCCSNPFSSKPTPFDPKGILSVRWCSISDPSKSPSALECETHPPSPWGSGRDAFTHSSPAETGARLRHSRWFPGAYAMLPSGTPSRPNTAIVTKYSYGWVWATAHKDMTLYSSIPLFGMGQVCWGGLNEN